MRFVSFDPYEPGVIAIGQSAVGIIAIGGNAVGVIAIGVVAVGGIAVACGAAGGGVVVSCGAGAGLYSIVCGFGVGLKTRAAGLGLDVLGDRKPKTQWQRAGHAVDPARIARRELDEGEAYVRVTPGRGLATDDGTTIACDAEVERALHGVAPGTTVLAHLVSVLRPASDEAVDYRTAPTTVAELRCDRVRVGDDALVEVTVPGRYPLLRIVLVLPILLAGFAMATWFAYESLSLLALDRPANLVWRARITTSTMPAEVDAACEIRVRLHSDGSTRHQAEYVHVQCGEGKTRFELYTPEQLVKLEQQRDADAFRYAIAYRDPGEAPSEDSDGETREGHAALVIDSFAGTGRASWVTGWKIELAVERWSEPYRGEALLMSR